MSPPATQSITEKSARLMHAVLLTGVVGIFAVLTVVRGAIDLDLTGKLPTILRYVGMLQLIVIGIIISRLRVRIPGVAGDGRDEWWAANGRRVIVLWVLAEGTATLGSVLWVLTGDPVLLVVLAAAFVLLFRLRPGPWTR